MDKCPHNNEIVCNHVYRLDEFYRQMKIAFENGAKQFVYTSTKTQCPAKFRMCPRFIAAQSQKTR